MKFETGQRVVKARRYAKDLYCFHDGDPVQVPIGTAGEVRRVTNEENVHVNFDNGTSWNLHESELDLEGTIGSVFVTDSAMIVLPDSLPKLVY